MRDYRIESIRNICLAGHSGSGKTSIAEAMLYTTGAISRLGSISTGNTVSDYRDEEIAHRLSLGLTPLHCDWLDYKIHFIDTPGYSDFTNEVKCAMRVVDSVVVVIKAIEGIEVETERAWEYANDYNLPRLIVVNLLDKEHADFEACVDGIRDRLGQKAIALQIPVGTAESFSGVIDLVSRKFLMYDRGGNGMPTLTDIPDRLTDQVEAFRERLVEAAAESDDKLLEAFFEEGTLTDDQLERGLRVGIGNGLLFPVLCTSATLNVGVSSVLDSITRYLPSPIDRPPVNVTSANNNSVIELSPDPSGPLAALVFKTISESHVGEMTYFRLFSGQIKAGDDVFNASKDGTERISQIYQTLGHNRTDVGVIYAGEIGATVKLKNTRTGDTLCSRQNPILSTWVSAPQPVANAAIIPRSKEDEEKISTGLSRLHQEDPSFTVTYDPEIKQLILSGAGETHLELTVERLKRRFGVEVDIVQPRIPYRETIKGKAESQGRYKRQTGGRGQFGDTWIRVEPQPRGSGYEFVDAVVGGAVPSRFIPAVDKGIQETLIEGVIAGYPVVDVKATLYDGSFHTVDSSEMAFKIAASMGFKKAFTEARSVLLEPIYEVEVVVPDEYMGDVLGDLSSRRGRILGMDPKGKNQLVRAEAPLAELYKYATDLRSITQGRGTYARRFSRYEEMPKEVEQKVIADANFTHQSE